MNSPSPAEHKTGHTMGHQVPVVGEHNRALKITSWLTGVYFIVELGLGIYSGSIAVISDAFHTFSAVGGVLLALVAARIAARPADKFKSFGRWRAEIIGALLNGFFLLVMALIVLYMGWMRLQNPIELPTTPMFLAAALGIITEVVSIKLLYSGQQQNLNIKGAFWHVLQTFVGSLIIIVAALIIRFTGFFQIDPVLGMLFGLVLLWASWSIIKGAFDVLLEAAPPDIDLEEVKEQIEAIPGVVDVHHIHAWVLTSGKNIFSSHVKIEQQVEAAAIQERILDLLKSKYRFYFSTVQVEERCFDLEADHIDITKSDK